MKPLFTLFLLLIFLTSSGQALKVMSYNIRYATENDGVNAWSKRKTKVFELLTKYDPDIIGVQEALLSQIEDILKALPQYAYTGVGRDDGKTAGEYSAILYKKEKITLEEGNTFWLSEDPGVPGSKNWDAAITRVATWAKMKELKSGMSFLIINTHFDHIGKLAREKSAQLLKQKAMEIGGALPTVIMGDLNTQREDAPYKTMMKRDGLLLFDPAPANPPGTYCTFQVNSTPCVAIDYIFHTSHWNAFNYSVIQDNDGKNYPSDHLPVMLDLTIKKK